MPVIENTIERDCIWIETISAHFGHSIVENPNRLWILLEDEFSALRDPLFVGFSTHKLPLIKSEWPEFLREPLKAWGVPIDAVEIIDKPTLFCNLYVPRAISPFSPGNRLQAYSKLMAKAGRSISMEQPDTGRPTMIYLSRSKLPESGRFLRDGVEVILEAIFQNFGFSILHTETMSFVDQVCMIRGATHIAGCVGSQLHLAAFRDFGPLKMFRIAPSFFDPEIDERIVAGLGGEVQTFRVEQPKPDGPRNLQSWALSKSVIAEIERAAALWLAGLDK